MLQQGWSPAPQAPQHVAVKTAILQMKLDVYLITCPRKKNLRVTERHISCTLPEEFLLTVAQRIMVWCTQNSTSYIYESFSEILQNRTYSYCQDLFLCQDFVTGKNAFQVQSERVLVRDTNRQKETGSLVHTFFFLALFLIHTLKKHCEDPVFYSDQ